MALNTCLVNGPFVHEESATRDVEDAIDDDVDVDEMILEDMMLLDVVLTLLVEEGLIETVEEDFAVDFEDVLVKLEVVFLFCRIGRWPFSTLTESLSTITAAEAVKITDKKAQRPHLNINITIIQSESRPRRNN